MAKAFSIASWNVQHFRNNRKRVVKIIEFLVAQNPDVLAIYEVEGKDVFYELVAKMPGYSFHITEGRQTQEIMVGAKKGFTSFFTQRTEFKSGNQFLRPGALLTLHIDNINYPILFLHTKSKTDPIGLGIRDDQFRRAFEFKRKVLDKDHSNTGSSNFIFLGDLNTMGMRYPFNKSINYDTELAKLDSDASKVNMRRLTKTQPFTWSKGSGSRYKPADLDHVIAASHLRFKQFSQSDIDVRGWPELGTNRTQDAWIKKYSDHALLYLVVQKV